MKKTLFILILTIFGLIINQSCKKFEENENSNEFNFNKNTFKIKNGIVSFSSKKDMKNLIKEIDESSYEEQVNFYKKLYKSKFKSYKPKLYPEIKEVYNFEKLQTKNSEDIIVGDPNLASLVNENHEIIVNDTLYKIENNGVFFAEVSDSIALRNYVNHNNSVVPAGINEPIIGIKTYRPDEHGGGSTPDEPVEPTPIGPGTVINEPIGGGNNGGSNGNGNNTNHWEYNENIRNILNNLPVCSGQGNFIQDLFGDTYSCFNYFDSRNRVKVEFWNQDFLFYASTGIQVTKQYYFFPAWWRKKADEMYLGINSIHLTYTWPKPTIQFPPNSIPQPGRKQIYLFRGNIKLLQGNDGFGNYYYTDCNLSISQPSLPFFDLDTGEEILNIYISDYIPYISDYNLTIGDLASEANIKKLYQMGIDFLRAMDSTDDKFIVTHQKNSQEVEVYVFDKLYHNTNENHLKKYFYQNYNFMIKWKINIDGQGGFHNSFSLEPERSNFSQYNAVSLDFYGMARKGNTWKGSRLIRNTTIN